jgi:hypothetical protein
LNNLNQLFHKDVVKGYFLNTKEQEYMPSQMIMALQDNTCIDFWQSKTKCVYKDKDGTEFKYNQCHMDFCGTRAEWEGKEPDKKYEIKKYYLRCGNFVHFHGYIHIEVRINRRTCGFSSVAIVPHGKEI